VARRAWNHRASNPDAYSIAVSEYSKTQKNKEQAGNKHMTSNIKGIKPAARLYKILFKDEMYQMGYLSFRLKS
jgi:hypothetical protein